MQEPLNEAHGLHRRQSATGAEVEPAATRSRRWPAGLLWILILALTSTFHFWRDAPSEGLVFAAAAFALCGVVLWGWGGTRRMGSALGWWLIGAIAVLGALAILLPNQSALMQVVVGAIGVAAFPFAWGGGSRARSPEGGPSRVAKRTTVIWASLLVLLCVWELSAFALGEPSAAASDAHPTISSLLEPQLTAEPVRAILIGAWIAGGAALLRRAVRR